jgi:16S rRNA (cytosine967-C5)-methyltransferase
VAGRLEPRERAFAHELAYGATRLRGRLDHLLAAVVDRGIDSLDATVLEILRLGAYQLLYLSGVPDYAAVSSMVELARRRVGPKPTGLVNAVLRRVKDRGDGPSCFPSPDAEAATFLSTWGSHPRWLVDRWLDRWGVSDVRALVDANNRRPRVALYALDVGPEEAVRILAESGIEASPVGHGSACVRLADAVPPTAALAALPEAIIQDPGANLVVLYGDVPQGTKVADLCAAPGGKVVAVADRAVYTLASDRSESRIRMIRENAHRTGRRIALVVADARRPPLDSIDVVLVDVPCTGTGTLARHPDARWRLRPESIVEMAALQSEILESAAGVVAPGGLLVYSTCSLEPEENEERVHAFLRSRPDFRVEATGAAPADLVRADGMLSVTPLTDHFDGAFAARIRRAA